MKQPSSVFTRVLWMILAVGLLALSAVVSQNLPLVSARTDPGTIAYARPSAATGYEVRLIAPDGSNDRRIWSVGRPDPQHVQGISSLAWRPDATELAFASNHESSCSFYESDIYAIRADGGNYRRISAPPACAQRASYPKGTVEVPVQNWLGETRLFFIYFEGAPGVKTISLGPGQSGTVTFTDVADYGDYLQWAVGINDPYRWVGIAGIDVREGGTVRTPVLSVIDEGLRGWGISWPTWRSDGSKIGYVYLGRNLLQSKPINPPSRDWGTPLINVDAESMPYNVRCLAWAPTPALANQLLYAGYHYFPEPATSIYRVTEGSTMPGEAVLTLEGGVSLLGLAWLPDGSGFLYSVTEEFGHRANIYEYKFDSNQPRRVTSFTEGYTRQISASPDGQRIAFEYQATGEWLYPEQLDLWLTDRVGGTPQLLVSNANAPAWSPRQVRLLSNKVYLPLATR